MMIGKTIAHYRILEKIGAGGMGEVYRALDTKLGREVAVKVLPASSALDPELLQRFRREAKAIAAFKHPNIVTIYSVEEVEGLHFITMELVEGPTLSEIIPEGGLLPGRFFEIALPLAKAVGCAHKQGITHRDLKPANIMMDEERRPKILDFGLAKLWVPERTDLEETIPDDLQMTKMGSILGTAAYVSPEQVCGGIVGAWSDIFSLGIIFYEILTGARPFCGRYPAEIMHNIVNEDPPPHASIPDALRRIIDRCLRKVPAERFQRADELLGALQEAVGAFETAGETDLIVAPPEAAAAIGREDWETAYGALHAIRERRELSPGELEMLGTCASWLGDFEECVQVWERAYAKYAKAEMNTAAARIALELAALYIEKNAEAIAGGWQKRAERLLQNVPDCIEHGLLLRRRAISALESGDHAGAFELNRRCGELAARFHDLDLQAVALHDQGRILVSRGDVEEGRALINEAMASAVSGEVDPTTLGNLYCRTMTVCRSLADFESVREWSEAAWRWCEPQSAPGYRGVCRIHSAETMRHLGLWDKAEQAARRACRDFENSGIEGHAGEAFNELGELALQRGNYREAEDAFERAHEFGHDPVPGLPLLRLAQGKGGAAKTILDRALGEHTEDRLRRAKLLTANITVSLANGELDRAADAVTELGDISKSFGCRYFEAHALMGLGALELAGKNYGAAAPILREALSIFGELSFPFYAAVTRVHLAKAYLGEGNDEDAKLQIGAARKTFRELGAKADLEAASRLIPHAE
ncbi:MAG: protein kinase [Candidatus Eisenbacteria bacterium]